MPDDHKRLAMNLVDSVLPLPCLKCVPMSTVLAKLGYQFSLSILGFELGLLSLN